MTALIADGPEERKLSNAESYAWRVTRGQPRTFAVLEEGLELTGPLHVDALRRAIAALAARHDVFRTTYFERDGEPVAKIDPSVLTSLAVIDCRAGGDRQAQEEIARQRGVGFDLAEAPLYRPLLLSVAPDRHIIYTFVHHIIFDARSEVILHRELSRLYRAYAQGSALPPPPRTQYREVAAAQLARNTPEVLAEHRAFFARHAPTSARTPTLAGMKARPPGQTRFRCAYLTVESGAGLGSAIVTFAERAGTTPYTIVFAAVMALLQLEGAQEVIVGFNAARRSKENINVLGVFGARLPLRVELSNQTSFNAVVDLCKRGLTDVLRHQDNAPTFSPGQAPLPYYVGLQYHAAWSGLAFELDGVTARDITSIERTHCVLDLELDFFLRDDHTLRTHVEYNAELISAPTMGVFLERYEPLLRAAIATPDAPIATLI